MKILVLCLSEGHGGLEFYALREIRYLLEQGYTCLPVVAKHSMLSEQLQNESIEPVWFKAISRRLPLLSARKLARLIDENDIDIIHFHWSKDLNLAVFTKHFSKRKVKLVCSRHMEITCSKHDIFHAWFYRGIDWFFTNTDLLKKEAQKYLPVAPGAIERLYIGVGVPQLDVPQCEQFYTEPDFNKRKLNLALFGRIEHGKGQHILIEALIELVKNQGLDISATLVGHAMDEKYTEGLKQKVITEQMDKHIQFAGFVKNPIEIMACFDTIVLTTYNETFGLVLAEAMRAGVAVIGTNAGGVPEIISDGETGLLVEPGKSQFLADALTRLYNDDSLRARLAKNGKIMADEQFSETRHFRQLEKKLQDLTDS